MGAKYDELRSLTQAVLARYPERRLYPELFLGSADPTVLFVGTNPGPVTRRYLLPEYPVVPDPDALLGEYMNYFSGTTDHEAWRKVGRILGIPEGRQYAATRARAIDKHRFCFANLSPWETADADILKRAIKPDALEQEFALHEPVLLGLIRLLEPRAIVFHGKYAVRWAGKTGMGVDRQWDAWLAQGAELAHRGSVFKQPIFLNQHLSRFEPSDELKKKLQQFVA